MTSAETTPDEGTPATGAPSTVRWYHRVLPVTTIALVAIGLATVLVPGVRDQVTVSTTHQPQPYVELYFSRTSEGQAVCTLEGGSVRVSFSLASHLPAQQDLAYTVSVAGADGEESRSGAATVAPGRVATVDEFFLSPAADGYEVAVDLPELDQQLRARCPRTAP